MGLEAACKSARFRVRDRTGDRTALPWAGVSAGACVLVPPPATQTTAARAPTAAPPRRAATGPSRPGSFPLAQRLFGDGLVSGYACDEQVERRLVLEARGRGAGDGAVCDDLVAAPSAAGSFPQPRATRCATPCHLRGQHDGEHARPGLARAARRYGGVQGGELPAEGGERNEMERSVGPRAGDPTFLCGYAPFPNIARPSDTYAPVTRRPARPLQEFRSSACGALLAPAAETKIVSDWPDKSDVGSLESSNVASVASPVEASRARSSCG